VNMVKARKKEEVKEKAAVIVEDIILDALIPPLKSQPMRSSTGFGTQSDTEVPASDDELNERTRSLFREKIRRGELEDRKIEIHIKGSSGPNVGMIGAGMMDEV